jgi:hypothetical protein
VICVLLMVCSTASAQSALPGARELLAQAAMSGNWGGKYSSVTDVRYRATIGTGGVPQPVGTDSVVRRYVDGDRVHVIVDLLDHVTPDGSVVSQADHKEVLFVPGAHYDWWYPLDHPKIGKLQIAKSTKHLESWKSIDQSDPATGRFLDGNIDGIGNIVEVMRPLADSAEVRREVWTGIDCNIVETQTAKGRMTIWIATEKPGCIVRYLVDQNDPATGPMREEFVAMEYQMVEGRTVVRSGRSTRSWIDPESRGQWQSTTVADRVQLDLHPQLKEAGLFTTGGVPNGIRVVFQELPNSGVDFTWKDGAPVANVDADLFDQLETSLQRTTAGEIAKRSVPASAVVDTNSFVAGQRRVTQLRVMLSALVFIAVAVMAGIYFWTRSRGVLQ